MDEKYRTLKGYFDDNALQHARRQDEYKVHILKQRMRKGVKEFFVRFDGFPEEENMWITESDLVRQ